MSNPALDIFNDPEFKEIIQDMLNATERLGIKLVSEEAAKSTPNAKVDVTAEAANDDTYCQAFNDPVQDGQKIAQDLMAKGQSCKIPEESHLNTAEQTSTELKQDLTLGMPTNG